MWKAERTENNPQIVFDILKKHKLLPDSMPHCAAACNALGSGGERFSLESDGELMAEVFVSGVVPHESASMDIIPVTKHFRFGYHEAFIEAMSPIFDDLFNEFDVRRVSAAIPASRSRTKKALCVLGFKIEGRIREAIKLHNENPQDMRMLGLLKSDYVAESDTEETSDGS